MGRLDYYGINKENREQILDSVRKAHSLKAYTISGAWLDTFVRKIELWKVKIEMNVVNSEAEYCAVVYLPKPEDPVAHLEANIKAIRAVLGTKLKFEIGFNAAPNACTFRTLKEEAEDISTDEDGDKFENFMDWRKKISSAYSSNLIDGHDVYSLQLRNDPFRSAQEVHMTTFFDMLVKKMGHVFKLFDSLAKYEPAVEEKSTDDDAFDIGLRPSKKFRQLEEARLQEQAATKDQEVTRERSDAFVDQFNKYLAGNASATESMVKAAEQMAKSGSFMAETAATLPKEIVQVQADFVNLIDKNINHTDNSCSQTLHQHAHAHLPAHSQSQQPGGSSVPSRPSHPTDMHAVHYSKEVERLRKNNGLGGKLYEETSREERKRLALQNK